MPAFNKMFRSEMERMAVLVLVMAMLCFIFYINAINSLEIIP
jgi:hypothetical protein